MVVFPRINAGFYRTGVCMVHNYRVRERVMVNVGCNCDLELEITDKLRYMGSLTNEGSPFAVGVVVDLCMLNVYQVYQL